MSNEIRRLYRSRGERMFGGVCGGIGEFFGIDPTIVRLTFVLVTFVWPFTPLLYLILLLVVPEEPLSPAATDAPAAVGEVVEVELDDVPTHEVGAEG
jgi:phage shock protein C